MCNPQPLVQILGMQTQSSDCMASPLTPRATSLPTPQPQFWVLLLPLSPLGEGRDVPETLKLHFGGTAAGPGLCLSHTTSGQKYQCWPQLSLGQTRPPLQNFVTVVRLQP